MSLNQTGVSSPKEGMPDKGTIVDGQDQTGDASRLQNLFFSTYRKKLTIPHRDTQFQKLLTVLITVKR
ncbi:Uncharacterised protein [Serratia entomophila]|nr:Uncharacterised protein [Serratia entomophila]